MLDPCARARLCPRLPHLGRPRRRVAHVNGHVPDDGNRQHLHPRLHRPEHARDVLRPLGHARRPRRDELGQLQFCPVRAVHCPVRRVRAARGCDGNDHPLPEVVIPPTYLSPLEQDDEDGRRRIYSYFLVLFFVDDLFCVISRMWAHLRTLVFAERILPITPPPCILHTNHYPTQPKPLIDSALVFQRATYNRLTKPPQSLFRGPPHSFSSACRVFLLL